MSLRFGIYSTFVLGDDGKVYDLAKDRFLPSKVNAVNAWTEKIAELDSELRKGDEMETMESVDYDYRMGACPKCGRKILVEMGLIGVPHHSWIMATCAECVKVPINDAFRERRPEAAAEIEKWLQK